MTDEEHTAALVAMMEATQQQTYKRRKEHAVTEQEIIEKVAQIIVGHCKVAKFTAPTLATGPLDIAQALADAGLLADCHQIQRAVKAEAERVELEYWRTGLRRKSWPAHPQVPDALAIAASLIHAQSYEDDVMDELLRKAAITIKTLRDGYGYAQAERDALAATVQRVRGLADESRVHNHVGDDGLGEYVVEQGECVDLDDLLAALDDPQEQPCSTIRALGEDS